SRCYRRDKRREKLLGGEFQVEAQPEREHPAGGGGQHVVRKSKRGSVTGLKRIQWICSRGAGMRGPPTAPGLHGARPARRGRTSAGAAARAAPKARSCRRREIGRASCRERVEGAGRA